MLRFLAVREDSVSGIANSRKFAKGSSISDLLIPLAETVLLSDQAQSSIKLPPLKVQQELLLEPRSTLLRLAKKAALLYPLP